jgi:hypothetical protein
VALPTDAEVLSFWQSFFCCLLLFLLQQTILFYSTVVYLWSAMQSVVGWMDGRRWELISLVSRAPRVVSSGDNAQMPDSGLDSGFGIIRWLELLPCLHNNPTRNGKAPASGIIRWRSGCSKQTYELLIPVQPNIARHLLLVEED